MTIEMTINGNTTSASKTVTATKMLIFDFSNLHQTTNGVFVQQTNSEITDWKTSEQFFPKNIFTSEFFQKLLNSLKHFQILESI